MHQSPIELGVRQRPTAEPAALAESGQASASPASVRATLTLLPPPEGRPAFRHCLELNPELIVTDGVTASSYTVQHRTDKTDEQVAIHFRASDDDILDVQSRVQIHGQPHWLFVYANGETRYRNLDREMQLIDRGYLEALPFEPRDPVARPDEAARALEEIAALFPSIDKKLTDFIAKVEPLIVHVWQNSPAMRAVHHNFMQSGTHEKALPSDVVDSGLGI